MLGAASAVFAQAAGDGPLQIARDLGAERRRFFAQDRRQRGHGRLPLEGTAAGDHFVQQRAEAEDVGAGVYLAALGLFRGHVADCAEDGALLGLRLQRARRLIFANRRDLGELGQPEVEHFDQAVFGHHHVAGLQVAMDNAGRMRRRQRVGNLHRTFQRLVELHPPARGHLIERLAGDVLHGYEVDAVRLVNVVDGDDVRVIQR